MEWRLRCISLLMVDGDRPVALEIAATVCLSVLIRLMVRRSSWDRCLYEPLRVVIGLPWMVVWDVWKWRTWKLNSACPTRWCTGDHGRAFHVPRTIKNSQRNEVLGYQCGLDPLLSSLHSARASFQSPSTIAAWPALCRPWSRWSVALGRSANLEYKIQIFRISFNKVVP